MPRRSPDNMHRSTIAFFPRAPISPRPHPEEPRAARRLEGRGAATPLQQPGGPMVRDALLRNAPHHEAGRERSKWDRTSAPQSGLMPATFTTLSHFLNSAAM